MFSTPDKEIYEKDSIANQTLPYKKIGDLLFYEISKKQEWENLFQGNNDSFFKEFADVFRRIFGDDTLWKEYLHSNKPSCNHSFSISDIHGKIPPNKLLSEVEKNFDPSNIHCLECEDHPSLEFVWNPEECISKFKEDFSKKVFSIIALSSKEKISGFSYSVKYENLKESWDQKFSKAYQESLNWDEFKTEISKEINPNKSVLYFAEWGVLPEYRNSGVSFELFRSSMETALNESGDIPAIGYTLEGGVAHRIFKGLGALECCKKEVLGNNFIVPVMSLKEVVKILNSLNHRSFSLLLRKKKASLSIPQT